MLNLSCHARWCELSICSWWHGALWNVLQRPICLRVLRRSWNETSPVGKICAYHICQKRKACNDHDGGAGCDCGVVLCHPLPGDQHVYPHRVRMRQGFFFFAATVAVAYWCGSKRLNRQFILLEHLGNKDIQLTITGDSFVIVLCCGEHYAQLALHSNVGATQSTDFQELAPCQTQLVTNLQSFIPS